MLDKIGFKKRSITKSKNGHFIMIRSIHQEVTLICKNRTLKYMKQNLTELKGGTTKATIIDGRFQHSSLLNDRTSR